MASPETGMGEYFDPDTYDPSAPVNDGNLNVDNKYDDVEREEDPIGHMTPTEHSDSFEPA